MIDRLQYYFMKFHKFTKKKIHWIRYCGDRPKNKHFAKAEKIYFINGDKIESVNKNEVERKSYMWLYSKYGWTYVPKVRKLFDKDGNAIWEKSVQL